MQGLKSEDGKTRDGSRYFLQQLLAAQQPGAAAAGATANGHAGVAAHAEQCLAAEVLATQTDTQHWLWNTAKVFRAGKAYRNLLIKATLLIPSLSLMSASSKHSSCHCLAEHAHARAATHSDSMYSTCSMSVHSAEPPKHRAKEALALLDRLLQELPPDVPPHLAAVRSAAATAAPPPPAAAAQSTMPLPPPPLAGPAQGGSAPVTPVRRL